MKNKWLVVWSLATVLLSACNLPTSQPVPTAVPLANTTVAQPSLFPTSPTAVATAPNVPQATPMPIFTTVPLPEYNALFYRETEWTGADADVSIPLSENVVLWLYGDTFISDIQNGKRVCGFCLVRNSIALQHKKELAIAEVDFFFGPPKEGHPTAFFEPPEGGGWFWPGAGWRGESGLFIFLHQMDLPQASDAGKFAWGKSIGSWLALIANPDESPDKWQISYTRVPYFSPNAQEGLTRVFGISVLKRDDFTYLYGFEEENADRWLRRYLLVARTTTDDLTDFGQWQFWTGEKWVNDITQVRRGFVIGSDYSISYQPALRSYVAVYTEPIAFRNVLLRYSTNPYGPWSEPITLYQCPEMDWDESNLCYAAKAHPELALESNELIITYAANSMNPDSTDLRLYWPHFLRVKFEHD